MDELKKLEYEQISKEIMRDRDLQFKVFWQSVAGSAVILSIFAGTFSFNQWSTLPFLVIAPHLVLIPACAIILNRALTANRKSGYMVIAFRRLSGQRVKRTPFINWEHDLCVLRQYGGDGGQYMPRRATTIVHMLLSVTVIEVMCFLVSLYFLVSPAQNISVTFELLTLIGGWVYLVFYIYMITRRVRIFFCTRYADSIQGYARHWQKALQVPEEVLAPIIKWDSEAWEDTLTEEIRSKKAYSHFWSAFLKLAGEAGRVEVKNRLAKPILMASVLWAIIIYSLYFLLHAERAPHYFLVTGITLILFIVCYMIHWSWEGRKYTKLKVTSKAQRNRSRAAPS